MADPILDLAKALSNLSANRVAVAAAPKLAAAIDAKFAQREAPQRTGALRKSVKVRADIGGIRVVSYKEYAEKYRKEILPKAAEVQRAIRAGYKQVLERLPKW